MLQVNYDDALRQIEAAGIILDPKHPLRFDARTQRWNIDAGDREKRGWTRLREWTSNAGNTYLVGHYGVWMGNDPGTLKIELPKRDDDKPALSPAGERFHSCRWRKAAENGAPEYCTHRDVLPMAGKTGFNAESWCPSCEYFKVRRAPRKREYSY